ncbi:hypothetical protein [Cysteiniphilum sp. 6C5]|uniref:hypothetical protein n=1 Tax=unclassified Cysteiniphilum TaxID=2610889 RepID=UPI003F85949B
MKNWFEFLHGGSQALINWLSHYLKQELSAYCDLYGIDDEQSLLINKNGSLLSVFELEGFSQVASVAQLQHLSNKLSQVLQPYLAKLGHSLQFVIDYKPTMTIEKSQKISQTWQHNLALLQADIAHELLQSKQQHLTQHCCEIRVFIVVSSHLTLLDKEDIKQCKSKTVIKDKVVTDVMSEYLKHSADMLYALHIGFLEDFCEIFKQLQLSLIKLDGVDAVKVIKAQLYPHGELEHWQPRGASDKLSIKVNPKTNDAELAHIALDRQLLTEALTIEKSEVIACDEMLASVVGVELFPLDEVGFYSLFNQLTAKKAPFRISYFIRPGGQALLKLKSVLAKFLAFSNSDNKLILNARDVLAEFERSQLQAIVKMTMLLTTYVTDQDQLKLKKQRNALVKAVNAWGSAQVKTHHGDPCKAYMDSIMAMTHEPINPATAMPMNASLYMLPLQVPARVFPDGGVHFRTLERKFWPYQSGSSEQVSWVEMIYARSGSGKSVLLNTLNDAVAMYAQSKRLPVIGIIDIGESSFGLMKRLQAMLPEHAAYIQYHRLSLSDDMAINVFDTPLGMRKPSAHQKQFLINFIAILLQDALDDDLPEGMTAMLSLIIDTSYQIVSDDYQPKQYMPNRCLAVDKYLDKQQKAKDFTHWWQVVDYLFAQGEHTLAKKAQVYAMPTLADTVSACQFSQIKDIYHKVIASTNETYTQNYNRLISAAIRQYPSLSMISKVDFSVARILSLDLKSLDSSASDKHFKQTTIGYMLARYVIGLNIYLPDESDRRHAPDIYQAYHQTMLDQSFHTSKRIVFDEFHRTSSAKIVQYQVQRDMREARKYKTQIALASQSLEDFSPQMISFATSMFIMGNMQNNSSEQVLGHFQLSADEIQMLKSHAHGPSQQGVTFLAKFMTKHGAVGHALNLVLPAIDLWTYTTTSEDMYVRNRLWQTYDVLAVLKTLARVFPKGTLQQKFKLYKQKYYDQSVDDILLLIIDELIPLVEEEILKESDDES